jgi:hypothetical protein
MDKRFPIETAIAAKSEAGVLDITSGDTSDSTYSLEVADQVVELTVNTANSSVTISLPSVVEAKGRIYSIMAVLVANSKHVYVTDKAGDDTLLATIDLDTTADFVILYSNGRRWFILASEMA